MISQVLTIAAVFGIAMASLPLVHEPVVHHAPQPYKFGYNVKDKHGDQYREEVGDGASGVKGSYGFTDARGVHRRVEYVADHGGFRAQVKTNEPGTANQDPAAVKMISSAPYAGHEAGHFAGPGLYGGGLAVGGPVLVESGLALNGYSYGGLGYDGMNLGHKKHGYGGLGYESLGYGGLGYGGLGYGGLGYGGMGYGKLSNGKLAYGGYGLGNGLLGGLGYMRYGY